MNELLILKKNVVFKRRIELVNTNYYRMYQEIKTETEYLATIVTAANWIITQIKNPQDAISFKINHEEITISQQEFTLFIPAYSIVQFNIRPGTLTSYGISSNRPINFTTPFVTSVLDLELLQKDKFNNITIDPNFYIEVTRSTAPSKISKFTKNEITKDFISSLSINSIAQKIATDSEQISRHFKKDYGITPVEYRSKIRITRAIERLILGASIIDTAMDVGFSDLSRFYKQFKKITAVSPKKYQI